LRNGAWRPLVSYALFLLRKDGVQIHYELR